MIAEYGVGDDGDREQLRSTASAEELAELSSAPSPHWEPINAFLDENMEEFGPRQDPALALDAFSQAAMEAQIELDGRKD